VKRFVTDNYNRALAILTEHKAPLMAMADALLQRETLDAEQVIRCPTGSSSTSRRRSRRPATPRPPQREPNWKERQPARAHAAAAPGHAGIGPGRFDPQ
jgi:hypothetical protein